MMATKASEKKHKPDKIDLPLQALFDKRITSRQDALWREYNQKSGRSKSDEFSSSDITPQTLEVELARVAGAQAALLTNRESGSRFGAANVQRFARVLQSFLRGYSAVLGVAEAADNQFTG
jgi:hypothetical protein